MSYVSCECPSPAGRCFQFSRRNDGEEAQQRLRIQEPEARKWRLAISWQDDDGRQHKMTRSTQVPCYEDKVGRNGKVRRNNRGRGVAEQLLREWRDEEVRKDEDSPAPSPAKRPSTATSSTT